MNYYDFKMYTSVNIFGTNFETRKLDSSGFPFIRSSIYALKTFVEEFIKCIQMLNSNTGIITE